jgi:hypothetical protein
MQQVSFTEVQNVLGNMEYPASKQQIIDEAINRDASKDVLLTLENIPNRVYNSSAEVIDEFEDFQKAVQVFHNRKYPATKQELVDEAKKLHIRGIIVRALEDCPDKEYNSPADVINECRARLKSR